MYTETLNRDFTKLRVVGWPRSGTHHIADLFRIYFGLRVSGDDITRYCTPDCLEPDTWGVYVYRDPRDILVSRFIQMYFRFEVTYQEILAGRTLSQTFVEWFVEGKDPHVVPQGTSWHNFISSWSEYLSCETSFVPVQHETLIADRQTEFSHVLWQLGVSNVDSDQLQVMHDAVLRTKRHPYSFKLFYWEDEKESLPCGIPGEWRRLMDDKTKSLVRDYCGEWLKDKGYEW